MSDRFFYRGDHAELAKATLEALGPAALTHDCGEFFAYDEARGIWSVIPAHVVRHTATGFAGCPVASEKGDRALKIKVGDVRGAEALARDELLSRPNRVTFDTAPAGTAFANGFVIVHDGRAELRPHAPEHRARHGYPWAFSPWSPSATPRFGAFLDQIFADCSEIERADRIALLQEFAGACLVGDALRYQQCLFLFGPGANGKSALLDILRAMFPAEALCSLPPQRWIERFSLAGLEGKRANLVSETPSTEILDGNAFKAVITGDMVTAERKHRDPFEFKPVAGHIFSTNSAITTKDHTAGFWRRIIILPLTRRFDESDERRIAPQLEVIAAELAGVVAWAIEGAARAQQQARYTIPAQSAELLKKWRYDSNQVLLFILSRREDDVVSGEDFYRQYKTWASENGHKNTLAHNNFGERVVQTGLYRRDRVGRGMVYHRLPTPP
jgi:P4 family phage/plasmid primase-like protien